MKATMSQDLLISGLSVGGATFCTNPLDVIKTRLQLHGRKDLGSPTPGLLRTGANIVRDEGVLRLWNGLSPAVARGFLYGGMRLGLYEPCKEVLLTLVDPAPRESGGPPRPPAGVGLKVAAGLTSGAIAAGLTSPTELVKTRLQAKGCQSRGTFEVLRQVVASDGVMGLWRGAVPSMARAALLTASQVATYDSIKREVMRVGGSGDTLWTQLAASSTTGLVTTTVTNPVDVIKTHMFVAGGAGRKGIVTTTMDVLRSDGIAGFFKGWTASYARLGPQTVLTFMISEALRKALGLEGL